MSTGIPYLGSKISLISKSEIRYEGILYTIDTKESTVALAKVRSFGTEDRPTDRPVAPRDEVYEYIIFRAHDIKDLRVSEPPKPQSTLPGGLTNDPAIVQHSLQHSSAPVASGGSGFPAPVYNQPPTSYGPVGTLPSYPVATQYTTQQQSQSAQQLSQGVVGSRQSESQSGSTTPAQRKSPTIDASVQVSGPPAERRQSPRGPSQRSQQGMGPRRQQQQHQQQHQQQQQHQHQQLHQQHHQQQHHQQLQQQHQHQQHPNQGMGNQQRSGGRRGGPSGQSGRPRQTAYRNSKPKEPLKFDREYDFEQANAEFQELENKLAQTKIGEPDEKKDDSGTETQVGDNHEDDDVVYYDKNKSFFDNISCEAIERNKGIQRIDWRQERKLNHETFGISANNWMRRNAWRGRGAGGFWRGGQRGGGQRGGAGRGGARPRNGPVPRESWSVVPRAEASGPVDTGY